MSFQIGYLQVLIVDENRVMCGGVELGTVRELQRYLYDIETLRLKLKMNRPFSMTDFRLKSFKKK